MIPPLLLMLSRGRTTMPMTRMLKTKVLKNIINRHLMLRRIQMTIGMLILHRLPHPHLRRHCHLRCRQARPQVSKLDRLEIFRFFFHSMTQMISDKVAHSGLLLKFNTFFSDHQPPSPAHLEAASMPQSHVFDPFITDDLLTLTVMYVLSIAFLSSTSF